jgi:hypothetical protein
MNGKRSSLLILSFTLAALIITVSLAGILIPGFYVKETPNWQAQSVGQDYVDLFIIVPCLILSIVLAIKGYKKAMLAWAGVISYIIYTFTIYCFAVHFNRMFVLYCCTLGLSVFSLIYFFAWQGKRQLQLKNSLTKAIAVYFVIISIGFYFLWLSEIIPAVLSDNTPQPLVDAGLVTNPVHVLDLAIFLPALFITAVLLLKKRSTGYLLAPVFLVFTILINITIGLLQVIMVQKGVASGFNFLYIMSALALISVVFLISYYKNVCMEEAK